MGQLDDFTRRHLAEGSVRREDLARDVEGRAAARARPELKGEELGVGQRFGPVGVQTLARAVVYPEAPRVAEPAIRLMRLTTVGLLPSMIRDGYGFSWDSRNEATLHRWVALVRRLLPLTPSIVRYWPAARAAVRTANRSGCPISMFRGWRVSGAFSGVRPSQHDQGQGHWNTRC